MRRLISGRMLVLGLVGLVGCATLPQGPNVTVLMGQGKTWEQYQYDALYCKDYASKSLGTTEGDQVVKSAVTGAAITAVLGTAAGAAIGAVTGSAATGAAIGAATGALTGTAMGAGRGQQQGVTLQQRYDQSYVVCMHAHQHLVPGAPLK